MLQQANIGVALRVLFQDLARAVGGSIVDRDDLEGRRVGLVGEQTLYGLADGRFFVVAGNDDRIGDR